VSQSSPKREARRNAARRNAAANEIAEAVSAGVAPNPESVRAWRLASMRLYAAQKKLRPRECGAPLGEGKQPAAPLRGVSRPVDRAPDAAPESGTFSTPTQPHHNP
jgi:hypothetical protein